MPVNLKGKELSTYAATHQWVYRYYGKATSCKKCNNINNFRCEWSNISGEYKRDINDWEQLCQSCHRRKDHGEHCKRGHPYEGNSYKRKDGYRQCLICVRLAKKRYRTKRKIKKL